jgi:hypothetical protein
LDQVEPVLFGLVGDAAELEPIRDLYLL